MSIRAVIFDIYRTLLEVLPPPAGAERQWGELWGDFLGGYPTMALHEFGSACGEFMARESAVARAAGIAHPEVLWTDAAAAVLPDFTRLSAEMRDEFILLETSLWHAVRLTPGAAEVLRLLVAKKIVLGLESNAQPYTLPELDEALYTAGLGIGVFNKAVRFLSFENGFSKPDPHAFRILATQLRLLGIEPREALVVGDRLDNDIVPALAQGFQAWHLTQEAQGADAGGWGALRAHLVAALP
jgi:FMN phosphatase YigB (HAD superfamily)